MSNIYDMTTDELVAVCKNHGIKGYRGKNPLTGKAMTIVELREFVLKKLTPRHASRALPAASQVSRGSVLSARPQASGMSALCNRMDSVAIVGGMPIDSNTIMNASLTQLKQLATQDLKELNYKTVDTPSFGPITKTKALEYCKALGHNGPMEEFVMAAYVAGQQQAISQQVFSQPRPTRSISVAPAAPANSQRITANETAAAKVKKMSGLKIDFSKLRA